MARDRLSFSTNDRVGHSVFGTGTISQVNEQYTTIVFDESGTRKFLTRMVELARSDTPAPAKPVRQKRKTKAK